MGKTYRKTPGNYHRAPKSARNNRQYAVGNARKRTPTTWDDLEPSDETFTWMKVANQLAQKIFNQKMDVEEAAHRLERRGISYLEALGQIETALEWIETENNRSPRKTQKRDWEKEKKEQLEKAEVIKEAFLKIVKYKRGRDWQKFHDYVHAQGFRVNVIWQEREVAIWGGEYFSQTPVLKFQY